jgi:hypothetical protein
MFCYRLYSPDPADGHFIDVLHFISECDSTAIHEVSSEQRDVSRELWNRGRKVKDFPACPLPTLESDGSNRLADLIAAGGRWRWNPLATHCQIVAEEDGRRAPDGCAVANDRIHGPDALPKPRLTANSNPGDASCKRHYI